MKLFSENYSGTICGRLPGIVGTRAMALLLICNLKILDVPQSGSVGNQTSSRNRSGQYIRQRTVPTNPQTPAQQAVRATLTSLSASWKSLTSSQQAGWKAFGNSFTVVNNLGTAIHLTGLQCYVKVNAVNTLLGDAVVAVPPALPAFVAPLTTGVTASHSTPSLVLAGATPATGTDYMVYASPQVSAGVSYQGNYRYLTVADTFTSGAFNLLTAYTAKFGALRAASKIFVKVVQNQAGMQDNGTVYTCIVS